MKALIYKIKHVRFKVIKGINLNIVDLLVVLLFIALIIVISMLIREGTKTI